MTWEQQAVVPGDAGAVDGATMHAASNEVSGRRVDRFKERA